MNRGIDRILMNRGADRILVSRGVDSILINVYLVYLESTISKKLKSFIDIIVKLLFYRPHGFILQKLGLNIFFFILCIPVSIELWLVLKIKKKYFYLQLFITDKVFSPKVSWFFFYYIYLFIYILTLLNITIQLNNLVSLTKQKIKTGFVSKLKKIYMFIVYKLVI